MTRGFIRRLYPIGPQKVRLSIPEKKITGARALRLGKTLAFRQSGSVAELQVPSVSDYEVIALT
jgi:hypothetical protein